MANKNEEIDLFYVFDKIRDIYHGLLANFYKFVQFLKRYWIILLVLSVGGYVAGMLWQSFNIPKKEATIIVQVNFDSANYVYDAIDLLSKKSYNGDSLFLAKAGIDPDVTRILSLEIKPIVNVIELMEKRLPSDRNLDVFISQIEDEEEDLLTSEVFYPEYIYHKIIVQAQTEDEALIDKILNYLNDNEKFNQIKAIQVAQTELNIQQYEKTILSIDAILDANGKVDNEVRGQDDIYINTSQNTDLPVLAQIKRQFMEEVKLLKTELTKYDNVVTVLNEPNLYLTKDFFDNKKILLPTFLLFFFFAWIILNSLYKKGRAYNKQ